MRISRRGIAAQLTAAAVLAAATIGPAVASSPPTRVSTSKPAHVRLPAPSGQHLVGERDIRLIDRSRHDPWVSNKPYRELMASIWYPAHDVAGHPLAHQMLPKAAAHFARTAAETNYDVPQGTVDWNATLTHAHVNAPVERGHWPVVLYSAGLGDPRTFNTTTVEDLASRGYVVITVDHTYEASEVQFPDGRLLTNTPMLRAYQQARNPLTVLKKMLTVRVADTRFVLDQLCSGRLALAGSMNGHDIGMFGHSGGGFETLETMRQDRRIQAGVDLDGIVGFDLNDQGPGLSPLARSGLRRPFLLMGSATNDHYTSTSWAALWQHSRGQHSRGWHRDMHMSGGEHASYTDAESIIAQLADRLPAKTRASIGWIRPTQAVAAQRHYVAAFFDRWLRHSHTSAFEHRDPRYPQLTPVR